MKTLTQESAQDIFSTYIFKNIKAMTNYHNTAIEATTLLEGYDPSLKLTHFDDIYDTLIYSNLVLTAIKLSPQINIIADLGAGSSIPTLLALKKSQRQDIQTVAVDLDPQAMVIGKSNADLLGISEQYHFKNMNLEQIFESNIMDNPNCLIASNPPYIAAPAHLDDPHFVPIHGGEDGAKFLLQILRQDYAPGTTLALLWGSLTRPHEIIQLIEEKYQFLHVEVYRIHFGSYTQNPLLKSYLYQLKEKGEIYFELDEKQEESQFVIGMILRAV